MHYLLVYRASPLLPEERRSDIDHQPSTPPPCRSKLAYKQIESLNPINMPTCCVGESLCGRKDFDPTKNHPCMNCRGYAHGLFCCFEWTSRADHGISITDDDAKKVKDPILPSAMVTHINSNPSKSDICKKCAEIVKGVCKRCGTT